MISDRGHIQTEQRNPDSQGLDRLAVVDAVRLMNREDHKALEAVGHQAPAIAQAVRMAAEALSAGGRLIYVGAGTSGRLGVLDAAECPPTFSTDPAMVVGVIAGGAAALQRSVEHVEDDPGAGAAAMRDLRLAAADVLVGIAAGGTTPFVHGAIDEARRLGAKTVFLTCTAREHIRVPADLFICLPTGPEVIAGSTRLKAGTATKTVLNIISTLAMVQIGKVYGNMMVDLEAKASGKLVDRAVRIIMQLTGLARSEALSLLTRAEGKVKRAMVMHRRHCRPEEADALLAKAGGKLREIIE